MDIVKVRNEDGEADAAEIQFLELPNEILTNIILKMNGDERIRMSRVNRRLYQVEKRAGNRSFTHIRYDSKGRTIEASYEENRKSELRLDCAHQLFNQSTTDELTIENYERDNLKNVKVERQLCAAFKTLVFQKLVAVLYSDCSRRTIHELVRGRKDIDVEIVWMSRKAGLDSANKMFMDLPPMNKCALISERVDMFLEEEALLHVVRNSNHTEIDCGVTARGLERAFEMICSTQNEKVVKFCVSPILMDEFRKLLEDSTFSVVRKGVVTEIVHCKSGAFLRYFVRSAQLLGREEGFYSIIMRTNNLSLQDNSSRKLYISHPK